MNISLGKFLWPGFGENIRVLEWIFARTDEEADPNNNQKSKVARKTPIGFMPAEGCIDTKGLDISADDLSELFRLDKQFLLTECEQIKAYFDENVNESMPDEIYEEIEALQKRVSAMP